MGHFTAIRDKAGALIGFTERGAAEPLFTQTLADTMTAVGATEPKEEEHKARRPSRLELAGLVAGLVLAVGAIAAMNASRLPQRPDLRRFHSLQQRRPCSQHQNSTP